MDIVKSDGHFQRISSGRFDDYFNEMEKFNGSVTDLLLNNDSTVVYHLDKNRINSNFPEPCLRPLFLGANYHDGHSEGDFKIIIQDVVNRRGPWVLFRPPGSNERIFYLQNMVFPHNFKPKFEEDVENPGKIDNFYLIRGNPLEVFDIFRAVGYEFVDHPISKNLFDELEKLEYLALH